MLTQPQQSFFPGDIEPPAWLSDIEREDLELRPHQIKGEQMLRESLLKGHKRVVLQAPCAFGKTAFAAHIIRCALKKGNNVIFSVNAINLISQTVAEFRRFGIEDVGVVQAYHELTDSSQPIQVCSVQTLMRRHSIPKASLVMLDECDVWYKFYSDWMNHKKWATIPFIGLSATPYTRGLGQHFSDLIIPATTKELIDQGFLVPYWGYNPSEADLSKVQKLADDYNQKQLAQAFGKKRLVNDAIESWLELGEDRPTICYGVDCAHAKSLQKRFDDAGVSTDYMDAYTPIEERMEIAKRSKSGETKVVCNVGILVRGTNWPWISCQSLNFKTISDRKLQQVIGRGLRTCDGKKDLLILDHGGSIPELGGPIEIEARHTELDMGIKKPQKKAENKEKLPKTCPKCKRIKEVGEHECKKCGFIPEKKTQIGHIDGKLVAINGKVNKYSVDEQREFYSGLKFICNEKKRKPGWAAYKFKARMGFWPNDPYVRDVPPEPPLDVVKNFVKSQNIRYAKRRRQC